MYNDDDFNWNHGISLAQTGNFKVCRASQWLSRAARAANSVWRRRARAQAAEEALLLVQNERYKSEYCYISWLAR